MSQILIEHVGHLGDDLMVANVARVSMNKQHDAFQKEADTRLIHYLAREKHWSPFSHPKIQLRVTLPIFIARQWEKHRIGAVRGYDIYDQNEVSRRYVDEPPECFFPDFWRARPEKSIKQGSGEDLPEGDQREADAVYAQAVECCLEAYGDLLKLNVAPEQARMVLPQSMFTQWIETGSLLYWARVCHLRLDGHAQYEIRQAALQVSELIEPLFPVSWKALSEYGV